MSDALGTPLPGWLARSRPGRNVLQGRFVRLEPLDAVRHGPALWRAVAGHDTIWDYLGYGPWAEEAAFTAWLATRVPLEDPLSFALVERASGEAQGVATLMEIRPEHGVIEVGHIFYGPALQRTPAATDAIALFSAHVFETLGYRRFEWKCNALNAPSRRAALRFGFRFEGTFRNHMVVKGRNRDTAWYAMTDSDWPSRRTAFAAWLAAENFDSEGRQRQRLGDLMPLLDSSAQA